jgi:calcium-dependent protein kinase
MEKCCGGELLERISNPKLRLSEKEIAEVMAQTCQTLKALHARRIVLCDLKPENILFRDRKTTKIVIIDFGLSQRCGKFQHLKKVAGTPSYIAPELLTKHYTSECDIYAVGIICFECFHGYLPWNPKKSPIDTIKQAKAGFKGDTKSGRGPWFNSKVKISDDAKDFITKCLDLDVTKRITANEGTVHPFLATVEDLTPFADVTAEFGFENIHLTALDQFVAMLVDSADTLPEKLLKDAATVFQKVAEQEKSTDGSIKWEGFQVAVKEILHKEIPEEALKTMFEHFDLDDDHKISSEEFLKICALQYARSEDARFNKMLISVFDPEGNGYISMDFLKDTLVKKAHLTQEVNDEVLARMEELSNKGKISYVDFAKVLDKETEKDASFRFKVVDTNNSEAKKE